VARNDNKTEKPTPRRQREARREGRTARSQEVAVAVSLLGSLITIPLVMPAVGKVFAEHTRQLFVAAPRGIRVASDHVLGMFAGALLPFLAVALVAGVGAGVMQVGFTYAPKALKPKLSHLSPAKGLQRFKPSIMGWEFLRNVLKLGLLAAIVLDPLIRFVKELASPLGLAVSLDMIGREIWILMLRAAGLAVAIAVFDYLVNRRRITQELKMTRQELRDEMRHSEGDPMVRARRRRMHLDFSRNRMIREVGTADVVVTNPTELAVALRYERHEGAPRVVAKGAAKLAARIRAEAYRNGVPVVERKPLARALYKTVKVGRQIPATLYEAVAVVLAVAYRRRRRVA
jgi:flagellar biosynthetic protein FlhB